MTTLTLTVDGPPEAWLPSEATPPRLMIVNPPQHEVADGETEIYQPGDWLSARYGIRLTNVEATS